NHRDVAIAAESEGRDDRHAVRREGHIALVEIPAGRPAKGRIAGPEDADLADAAGVPVADHWCVARGAPLEGQMIAVAGDGAVEAGVGQAEEEGTGAGAEDANVVGQAAQPVADDRHIAGGAEIDGRYRIVAVVLVAGVEEPLAGAGPEDANVLEPVAVPVAG